MLSRQDGDIIAIPFFALSLYYFMMKNTRTTTEDILLLFSAGGLIADSDWTYHKSV